MGKTTMGKRAGWAGAALLLLLLGVGPARAVDASGVIWNAENKAFEGVVRWKGVTKVYTVTMKNGVELEIPLKDVDHMRIAEPAGFKAAVEQVREGKGAQAIPVLDQMAQDYAMLQWDVAATRWLAEACLRGGKPDKAVSGCERVIERKPDAAVIGEMAPVYWQALLAAGRNAKLDEVLTAAGKSTNPEALARIYLMRGDMLKKQNDPAGALREGYLRTVVLCPTARGPRAEALFKASKELDELGQVNQAGGLRGILLREYADSEWAQRVRAGDR